MICSIDITRIQIIVSSLVAILVVLISSIIAPLLLGWMRRKGHTHRLKSLHVWLSIHFFSTKHRKRIALALMFLYVIGSSVLFFEIDIYKPEVPDITTTRMSYSDARKKLENSGFYVKNRYKFATKKQDRNLVVEQSPKAGDRAKAHSTVEVTIEAGPPCYTVVLSAFIKEQFSKEFVDNYIAEAKRNNIEAEFFDSNDVPQVVGSIPRRIVYSGVYLDPIDACRRAKELKAVGYADAYACPITTYTGPQ